MKLNIWLGRQKVTEGRMKSVAANAEGISFCATLTNLKLRFLRILQKHFDNNCFSFSKHVPITENLTTTISDNTQIPRHMSDIGTRIQHQLEAVYRM